MCQHATHRGVSQSDRNLLVSRPSCCTAFLAGPSLAPTTPALTASTPLFFARKVLSPSYSTLHIPFSFLHHSKRVVYVASTRRSLGSQTLFRIVRGGLKLQSAGCRQYICNILVSQTPWATNTPTTAHRRQNSEAAFLFFPRFFP
jgi:hypothetical protein